MENICPVCNYNKLFEPPYDSEGYGSDEICPCCGFQFGCDDYPDKMESQRRWREEWIKKGCIWFSKGRPAPHQWNATEQLNKKND